MTIDISRLSTAELDGLIEQAARRRAELQPEVPYEIPKTAHAVFNPAWFVTPTRDGSLLQMRHVGYGWLAFLIPPPERVQLMTFLLQQSLIPIPENDPAVPSAAPAPTSGGGGKLH